MAVKYDVIFLIGGGIGNIIEALYAVEYAKSLRNIKVGLICKCNNKSFEEYVNRCYESLIPENSNSLQTRYLIHSWLIKQIPDFIQFDHYAQVHPDKGNTKLLTETEQFLSLTSGLFPGGKTSRNLYELRCKETAKTAGLNLTERYVVYPGCTPITPQRRWPYFDELVEALGEENVVLVGSKFDLDFTYSYCYPKYIARILPQAALNKQKFWRSLKSFGLLKPYAHVDKTTANAPYAYFDYFDWDELVFVLRNCKLFVGNDGGIMHLAGASGAEGVALFGPSSLNKSRPYSDRIHPVSEAFPCQPCFYPEYGIVYSKRFMSCPFSVKCLSSISVNRVLGLIEQFGDD